MVQTTKFIRKPLYVDAVQVTVENLADVSQWCQGEVRQNIDDRALHGDDAANIAKERYIHVRVHNPKNVRQTKAYVGDWLLYTERGYKVYTQKAFRNSFEPVAAPPAPTKSVPQPVPAQPAPSQDASAPTDPEAQGQEVAPATS